VRIGRSALDEAAIRLIEEHNPDIEFDWTRILKGQDAPVDEKPVQQDRRGKQRPREFPPRPSPPRGPAPIAKPQGLDRTSELTSAPAAEVAADRVSEPIERVDERVEGVDEPAERIGELAERAGEPTEPADQRVDDGSEAVDVAAIDELLSDSPAEPRMEVTEREPTTAAQARLGSEGLSRLRARHSEVLARISETVTDPVRRDELKSQAERLNPDTWVTDAEVSEGLEAYETVFESLRTVVGRRRRRQRRGRSREAGSTESRQESSSSSADSTRVEEPDSEDPGEDL
jgi:hypothetical protein